MELREELERAQAFSREQMEERGEVLPFFLAWDGDGVGHYLMTPWGSEEEKVRTLGLLRLFFRWRRVTHYVQVSEAWVIERTPEQRAVDRRAPAECEDRREVIVVNAVSHDAAVAGQCPIARDGDVVAVGELKVHEGESTGRMMDLLPPRDDPPAPPEVDALMRELFNSMPHGTF